MTKPWICILTVATAAGFLFVGSTDRASALCNPGTPNCIKRPINYPTRGKTTLGNAGDCVGTTNDTCGYHTRMARTASHTSFGNSHTMGSLRR